MIKLVTHVNQFSLIFDAVSRFPADADSVYQTFHNPHTSAAAGLYTRREIHASDQHIPGNMRNFYNPVNANRPLGNLAQQRF